MSSNSHSMPAPEFRFVHLLLVATFVQTLLAGCVLWAIGLLLVTWQSGPLQDWIAVCSAVVTALLKVGLCLLAL
jgi:hypothetical protein